MSLRKKLEQQRFPWKFHEFSTRTVAAGCCTCLSSATTASITAASCIRVTEKSTKKTVRSLLTCGQAEAVVPTS
jgi:hypothetical protein